MRSLIGTQVLVAFNMSGLFSKRTVKSLAVAVVMIVAMLPAYGLYIYTVYKAFSFLASLNALSGNTLPLHDMLLTGFYSLAQIMALMLGVPVVYSALLKANDMSILLPLPYKPWQILAAKLIAMYVAELLISTLFFAPVLVMNAIFTRPDIVMILNGVVSMLALPVIPLAISAMLSLLVMNIPGIGRSKWFWQACIMVIVLGIVLAFNTLIATGPVADMKDLIAVKMHALSRFGSYVPGSVFAMKAMVLDGAQGLLYQALSLLSIAAYVIVVLLVGEGLYIRPVLRGENARSKSGRRAEETQVRGFLMAYVRKEFACTLRDFSVAMNSLGGYFGVPLCLLIYTAQKAASKGKIDIIGQIQKGIHSPGFAHNLPIMIVGAGLMLALIGSTSSLFAASYSKDGKRLWLEKTLPVSSFDILKGKLLMGMIMVTILNALTVLAASVFVPIPSVMWIYAFALSEVVITYNATIGLLIDCSRPKLIWKDTVQAVKQNMNVMIALLVTTAFMGLNAYIIYLSRKAGASAEALYAIVFAANALILAGTLYAAKHLSRAFEKVIV